MPGKAEASAPRPFWRWGRGNCWAAQREPGPAGSCVPVWAGTRWERLLCPRHGRDPRPSASGCREGGFLQRAFTDTRDFSTYCSAETRLVHPMVACSPCLCGSHIGFVQRAVSSPWQLFKWLPVPMSRSIRPALQNTDPVMKS